MIHRAYARSPLVLLLSAAALGCGVRSAKPASLGGRDVQAWVNALDDPRPHQRRQALLKLGDIPDEPVAKAAIIRALGDPDPMVRREAIYSAAKAKELDDAAIERVNELAQSDPDASVREAAGKLAAKRKR